MVRRLGDRGAVSAAENACLVWDPNESEVSKFSAPPKTLRNRAVALCGSIQDKGMKRGIRTYGSAFIIPDFCGRLQEKARTLTTTNDEINVFGRSKAIATTLKRGLNRREDVGTDENVCYASGCVKRRFECPSAGNFL